MGQEESWNIYSLLYVNKCSPCDESCSLKLYKVRILLKCKVKVYNRIIELYKHIKEYHTNNWFLWQFYRVHRIKVLSLILLFISYIKHTIQNNKILYWYTGIMLYNTAKPYQYGDRKVTFVEILFRKKLLFCNFEMVFRISYSQGLFRTPVIKILFHIFAILVINNSI